MKEGVLIKKNEFKKKKECKGSLKVQRQPISLWEDICSLRHAETIKSNSYGKDVNAFLIQFVTLYDAAIVLFSYNFLKIQKPKYLCIHIHITYMIYIYIYIVCFNDYIYIMLILLLSDLSTLCVMD